MLSGDTTRLMDPDTSTNTFRKIKPFCKIYEEEIVFYALQINSISIRTMSSYE